MLSKESVGCCGAFCGTCPALAQNACKGCKLGYATGERDLTKARCGIKVCCMAKGFATCAECRDYVSCETLNKMYSKKGYKYSKYREALEFIRSRGYDEFLRHAKDWKVQYGKYN